MAEKSWKDCDFAELCRMKRDHFDVGDFNVMTDANVVWLSEQPLGHDRNQHIEIPREVFNRLIRAYLLKRKLRTKPHE